MQFYKESLRNNTYNLTEITALCTLRRLVDSGFLTLILGKQQFHIDKILNIQPHKNGRNRPKGEELGISYIFSVGVK